MLYLIGLGFDEKDITLKALDVAKKCECYFELYTSVWQGSIKNLEEIIGKKIKKLERSDLEENLQNILSMAKSKDIAIFVPGDPLGATTHIDIVLEARKQKIPVKVIHNISIFSAIGESGLQLYKFGKTATIPMTKQLEFVKDSIKTNRKAGLHTMLILDIGMNSKQALEILLEAKLIKKDDKLIIAKIGTKSEMHYDKAINLLRHESAPAVLVIPGKLHFKEKEFLEHL